VAAAVRWQVRRAPCPRTPAARRPPGLALLPARDGHLRWPSPSVGAWGFIPRPWMSSARSGRRPSAHLAWRRWAARRVPGLVSSPPAWDRSNQRTVAGGRGPTASGATESFRGHPGRRGPGTVAADHPRPPVTRRTVEGGRGRAQPTWDRRCSGRRGVAAGGRHGTPAPPGSGIPRRSGGDVFRGVGRDPSPGA